MGTALQAWLAHIDEVRSGTLVVRTPRGGSLDELDDVPVEWIALLVQLVLHTAVTAERLQRITGLPATRLRSDLNTLIRTGLVTENMQGVIELNRFARHMVIEHLDSRGLLA